MSGEYKPTRILHVDIEVRQDVLVAHGEIDPLSNGCHVGVTQAGLRATITTAASDAEIHALWPGATIEVQRTLTDEDLPIPSEWLVYVTEGEFDFDFTSQADTFQKLTGAIKAEASDVMGAHMGFPMEKKAIRLTLPAGTCLADVRKSLGDYVGPFKSGLMTEADVKANEKHRPGGLHGRQQAALINKSKGDI